MASAAICPEAIPSNTFKFLSGCPDCVTSNPEHYSVEATIDGVARLVLMKVPPGGCDKEHDHPKHSMYVIEGAKLELSPPPGGSDGESAVVELPTGAAPIIPAGKHVVKNVGDTTATIVFVEPFASFESSGFDSAREKFMSPFDVTPCCYEKLNEDDDWVTGMLTMDVGQRDAIHHHRDHVIYFLEGDEITITPIVIGEPAEPMVVPLKTPCGVAAPMAAAPFACHTLKNTGSKPVKAVFFEAKK